MSQRTRTWNALLFLDVDDFDALFDAGVLALGKAGRASMGADVLVA